ncbi:hypothetical protein ACEQ8H_005999 [Pleosporales sp. CAS-2024a]
MLWAYNRGGRPFGLNNNSRMALWKPTSPKAATPVRETVTYPKIVVTKSNNPCLDFAQSFEHVLSCGHLISTAAPNVPCAPNCHHVAADAADVDRSLKHTEALKMKNGKMLGDKPFYCDACVETVIEDKIDGLDRCASLTSAGAEDRRTTLRADEAQKRMKDTKFVKCYIALKVTSIKCHVNGRCSSRYEPGEKRHPFDRSCPRTGENMFEDVDPNPVEDKNEDEQVAPTVSKAVANVDGQHSDKPEIEHTRTTRRTRTFAFPFVGDVPRVSTQQDLCKQALKHHGSNRQSISLDEDESDDGANADRLGSPSKRVRSEPEVRRSSRTRKPTIKS